MTDPEIPTAMGDQRRRTAIHEASHGVVAAVLRTPVRFLSIRPTEHYGGIMVSAPRRTAPHNGAAVVFLPSVILWPARTRRLVETRAFISLAGPIGALNLGPRYSGYLAASSDDARAEADAQALARLHPVTRSAVQWQEAAVTESLPSDEDFALDNANGLVGKSEAAAWLGWARASVAHLILEHAASIEAVADELEVATVISGRRMLAVMRSGAA